MKHKAFAICALFLLGISGGFAAETDAEFRDPFAGDNVKGKEPVKVSDPLERINRCTYKFNDKFFEWLLKPAAKGYRFIVPTVARESLDRCFVNLKYPIRLVNNLLQGRFTGAAVESGRFLVNTTVGVGGFFDPAASRCHLKAHPADFDQTLGFYRIPPGFFITLPLLGSSSPRGVVGQVGDSALTPWTYVSPMAVEIGISATEMLNRTSLQLEEYETLKSGTLDPYVALRSAYYEHRAEMVKAAHEPKE